MSKRDPAWQATVLKALQAHRARLEAERDGGEAADRRVRILDKVIEEWAGPEPPVDPPSLRA
jgi:hypothetical protein